MSYYIKRHDALLGNCRWHDSWNSGPSYHKLAKEYKSLAGAEKAINSVIAVYPPYAELLEIVTKEHYFNITSNGEVVDTFDTEEEAEAMLREYNMAFKGGCEIWSGFKFVPVGG